MSGRKLGQCGQANGVLRQLGNALHRLEQAWMHSAERTRCFELHTTGEDEEGVSRVPLVTLRTGQTMPPIGLGECAAAPGEQAYSMVLSALRIGYRHIVFHEDEEDVARALADSGVSREAAFLTAELWLPDWGYERARAAVRSKLERLRTPYLDLLLLHCPGPEELLAETWRALEACLQEGLVRAIGVSNCTPRQLEALGSVAEGGRVAPAAVRLDVSPFQQQRDAAELCRQRGIVLLASSPLCKGCGLEHPTVVSLSQKLGVTPAQLLIRWSLQKGYVPLPLATSGAAQREDYGVFGFCIPEVEMAQLDALEGQLAAGRGPQARLPAAQEVAQEVAQAPPQQAQG